MATWTNKCSVEKKLCKNRAFSHKVICSPFLHRCTLELRSFFVGTLGLRLIVMHGNLDQQVQVEKKLCKNRAFSDKVICSPFLHRCTLELRSFFVGTLGLRLIVMHGNLDQQVQVEKKLCKNRAFSHKVICSPFLHRCTLELRSFFVGTLGLRLIVMHGNLDQQVQRREKVVQKSCFFP